MSAQYSSLSPPFSHEGRESTPSPPVAKTVTTVPLEALDDGPSIFHVLNIFRCCWLLDRDHLIANILSSQKDKGGKIHWVDFQPAFHTHLIWWVIALLPPLCPIIKGKCCMFVFLLEVLALGESGLVDPRGLGPFLSC